MNSITTRSALLAGLISAVALAGCSGMSRQERNTTTGAVAGGVAGAVITDSPVGAAVGAVVGGVIGHEADKKK